VRSFIDGLYHIDGFSSVPIERGCGFSIHLRGDIASDFARQPNSDAFRAQLQVRLLLRMKKSDRALMQIHFHDDSMLLKSLSVGRDCACFFIEPHGLIGIETSDSRLALKYASHNIDTLDQAAAILDIWLHWFNTSSSFLNYNQPLAI
jgi:hypothetical protein